MQKMPEFYRIFARKIPFPRILGTIPGSKAESERIRPQHQLRDNGGHRSMGAIVLNELFMRQPTLLHSISLDTQSCDAVTKKTQI